MKTKKKGLTKLAHLVFSRTTFIFITVLLQLFVLFLCFYKLNSYSGYIYSIFLVIGIVLSVYILNRWDNPMYKLAWIIPILAFPVFGSLMYLYCESQIGSRMLNKKITDIINRTRIYYGQSDEILKQLDVMDAHVSNMARYMDTHGSYPIYTNTDVTYFESGEKLFPVLLDQLRGAKEFIFLEFFIIAPGKMWNIVLDILKDKVKQGVTVKIMYDGTNSLFTLPYGYYKDLQKIGISCKAFAPIVPVFTTVQNNRDHRKIVVVDGHTAITGGINLADEYINEIERFGYWKDSAVMLKGDAAKSFTVMFLQLWNVDGNDVLPFEKYLRQTGVNNDISKGYVIGYSDSPLDAEPVGKNIYIDILYTAKKYVHIITPYLVLDNELTQALIYAAKRGVDVSIIMPGIPDKKYVYCLGRTYYEQLIHNGVNIYEFTPGFTHAKMFISDDEKAVVGSINLDFRSLYLHFESAAFIYKSAEIKKMEADFNKAVLQSHSVTLQECKDRPLLYKLFGKILRLVAPLM